MTSMNRLQGRLPDMSENQHTPEERYRLALESFERDGFATDPSWLADLRRAAMSSFSKLGFPTARRGNEEWKYTDVSPIAKTAFSPVVSSTPPALKIGDLKEFTFGEVWPRLVFIDGAYVKRLSSVSSLPDGVTVANLAAAMSAQPALLEEHLARYADHQSNAFTALNTAFLHEGALVHIPDGVILEKPLYILFLSTSQEPAAVFQPRVLILLGKDSKATVIENYAALSSGVYFANAVTEAVVGPGSALKYYKLQRQSEQASHITTTQVSLQRDSSFSSVNIDLGGGLVRNNLNVLTDGEGASCALNGLYMVTGAQHVDNQVIIDHAKPYTTSREVYKGILDGKSRSVFHGSIFVRKDARKVDARQEDKNLLLSPLAEADTKPAFWIYCDDVKCSHGAACGQIDENALFYLRSRGLDEKAARRFLVYGFVSEVVNSIENEAFRAHIDGLVQAKLEDWLGAGAGPSIPQKVLR